MPGGFGRLVGVKQAPKSSCALATEQEHFWVGRPDTCSNALLILLATFVPGPKWAQVICLGTCCRDLRDRPEHLNRDPAHFMEVEGDTLTGPSNPG